MNRWNGQLIKGVKPAVVTAGLFLVRPQTNGKYVEIGRKIFFIKYKFQGTFGVFILSYILEGIIKGFSSKIT